MKPYCKVLPLLFILF